MLVNSGTADQNDLDGSQCNRRSHVHITTLMRGYSMQELRMGWGIVDQVLVCVAQQTLRSPDDDVCTSLSQHTFHVQIFTSSLLLIFCTRLSRAHSRIIWSSGSTSTLLLHMVKHMLSLYGLMLIVGNHNLIMDEYW